MAGVRIGSTLRSPLPFARDASRRAGRAVGAFAVALPVVAAVLAGTAAPSRSETAPAATAEPGPAGPLAFGPVKLGLDSLVRVESARSQSLSDFSFAPGNRDRRILVRMRPSAAYESGGPLGGRVEGQWYAAADERDFSTFTMYQAYVNAGVDNGTAAVRAGRQELVYGSAFLLGADAFYDGHSFDAVRFSAKPSHRFSLDLFGGQYVRSNSGGIAGKLYGAYATYALPAGPSVDLYLFRDSQGSGPSHPRGEHETTYSAGFRLAGSVAGIVGYEVEPVWQFGRKAHADAVGHDRIRAFGGHADVTADPPIGRYKGKLFLGYAFGTGDGDPGDGRFEEFHNPNNDTSLVGDMNVIGDLSGVAAGSAAASGLHAVTAGAGSDVTEKLNVSLSGHWFRADRAPTGISRDVGVEANLVLAYALREGVSLILSANRFFTGAFFKDAAGSGKDIDYVYTQLRATF